MTGPPNAADIAAIKSQFAATMLGSYPNPNPNPNPDPDPDPDPNPNPNPNQVARREAKDGPEARDEGRA